MAELIMTEELGDAAVLGGAVLGGGGGGGMEWGRQSVKKALASGTLRLVDVEDLSPDAILITGSMVGAPAATGSQVLPKDCVRAVEILTENKCPLPGGFISNECGGLSITNGWIPAALMGLPLVDALCNGRAHPTGVMGSMGLHRDPRYVSRQAAVGGNPDKGMYLELYVTGKLDTVSPLVRAAADRAGGMVAVARNPVQAGYAARYGAPGALKQSIELGKRMRAAAGQGGRAAAQAAAEFLGGDIIAGGPVSSLELVTRGGFDTGTIGIAGYETTFWNEFMTLEKDGKRIGTFPDLIMTLDAASGLPVTTAELRKGQEVFLLLVSAAQLILGEGMRCKELLEAIEPVVKKSIVPHTAINIT